MAHAHPRVTEWLLRYREGLPSEHGDPAAIESWMVQRQGWSDWWREPRNMVTDCKKIVNVLAHVEADADIVVYLKHALHATGKNAGAVSIICQLVSRSTDTVIVAITNDPDDPGPWQVNDIKRQKDWTGLSHKEAALVASVLVASR